VEAEVGFKMIIAALGISAAFLACGIFVYIGIRWRRAPNAFRAMYRVAAVSTVSGILGGIWMVGVMQEWAVHKEARTASRGEASGSEPASVREPIPNPKILTRESAVAPIEADLNKGDSDLPYISFPFAAVEQGKRMGLWTIRNSGAANAQIALTEKGKRYFSLRYSIDDPGTLRVGNGNSFGVEMIVRRRVTVTGISEGPTPSTSKYVEFRWMFDFWDRVEDVRRLVALGAKPVYNYRGEEKPMARITYSGGAYFELFDDGWRLVRVRV
jgi:hypothetical protein